MTHPTPITVALAEDNEFVCMAVKDWLSFNNEIEYLGHAGSVREFRELVTSRVPDVALLDLDLEEHNDGIKILKWLEEIYPGVKSIIMTVNENEIAECYQLGAKGYILKSHLDGFVDTVLKVYRGDLVIPSNIGELFVKQIKEKSRLDRLKDELRVFSEREVGILQMLKGGVSRGAIAKRLCISVYTVKRHLENIREKGGKVPVRELLKKFREVI